MKEIVIKISDEFYEKLMDRTKYIHDHTILTLGDAVRNGKVLPKGHGKIGDVTELQKTFHNLCDAYGIDNLSFISDMDMNFDLMPNLVEADKGDTDGNKWK